MLIARCRDLFEPILGSFKRKKKKTRTKNINKFTNYSYVLPSAKFIKKGKFIKIAKFIKIVKSKSSGKRTKQITRRTTRKKKFLQLRTQENTVVPAKCELSSLFSRKPHNRQFSQGHVKCKGKCVNSRRVSLLKLSNS